MSDFLIQAGLIIVTSIVTVISQKLLSKSDTREILKRLLLNDMRHIWLLWHERDYIPMDVMAEFNETHAAYKKLGGNGTGDKMHDELTEKPLKGE